MNTYTCNDCMYAEGEGEGFCYCYNKESKYYGDCVEDAPYAKGMIENDR